jgi:catechol 2,3-dioxygenase-like lactoylglutathione lyase family enzyme
MTANATAGRKRTPLFKESEAFASFSIKDIRKAKEFYGQTLGLQASETHEGLELKLGTNAIFLYPKPNHTPASFTVLNFPVNNIDEAVKELKSLGIRFEHYEMGDIRTDQDGIARGPGPKIAWFKDPDGNILSVLEE